MRLQTVDQFHPLVRRMLPPLRSRGRGAKTRKKIQTKLQRFSLFIPSIPRPALRPPHFSRDCRKDPTGGIDKETAAKAFKEWWSQRSANDVTIFSDGSEAYIDGEKFVGYGYAVYQGNRQLHTGYGSINTMSHVFDAEAIGAWKGLQKTLRDPALRNQRIWQCIDSTSVIWCVRGRPYFEL